MNEATLQSLAQFPDLLDAFYAAIPARRTHWKPPSWDGIPSESLTAIEQLCHVRDVEIDGYQLRIERTLAERNPELPSLDTYELAKTRDYAKQECGRSACLVPSRAPANRCTHRGASTRPRSNAARCSRATAG